MGITRARERLYLTRSTLRSAWGQPSYNPPSRFLEEVPEEYVEWKRTGPWPDGRRRGDGGGLGIGLRGRAFSSARRPRRRAGSRPGGRRNGRWWRSRWGTGSRTTASGWARCSAVKGGGDAAEATIDFGDEKPKRLLLRYAPVEKL